MTNCNDQLAERTAGRFNADEIVRLIEHKFHDVCETEAGRRAFCRRIRIQVEQLGNECICDRERQRRAADRQNSLTMSTP